jgi:prophage antirepressor-like protein
MNDLKIFESPSFGSVRTITKDGEPWFVAADVCKALDIADTWNAVNRLDDDEKGLRSIQTPGGEQSMVAVNEAGLYSLILGSRKPEAKDFKRWVTHDVLPSIRKTGKYEVKPMSQLEILAEATKALVELDKKTDKAIQLAEKANERVDKAIKIFSESGVKDWRQSTNDSVRQMCQEYGLSYMVEFGQMYDELEDKASVDIERRVKFLRSRLINEGHTRTEANRITKLEIISRDTKLRAIFDSILRMHMAKHANAREFETG